MHEGKTIDQLKVGEKASMRKTITESDVVEFARISGDTNPLHLDEEYASKSLFKERVAILFHRPSFTGNSIRLQRNIISCTWPMRSRQAWVAQAKCLQWSTSG